MESRCLGGIQASGFGFETPNPRRSWGVMVPPVWGFGAAQGVQLGRWMATATAGLHAYVHYAASPGLRGKGERGGSYTNAHAIRTHEHAQSEREEDAACGPPPGWAAQGVGGSIHMRSIRAPSARARPPRALHPLPRLHPRGGGAGGRACMGAVLRRRWGPLGPSPGRGVRRRLGAGEGGAERGATARSGGIAWGASLGGRHNPAGLRDVGGR
jgi:hypothetical protein